MKNWKVLVVFGSVWLLGHAGFAQKEALKKAKYEVLKRCLEYLARDSPNDPQKISPVCDDCTTVKQCNNYAENIKKGEEFVDFANPDKDPNLTITDYKKLLIDKLIKNKPNRAEEAVFKDLKATIDAIVVTDPTPTTSTEVSTGKEVVTTSPPPNSVALDSAQVAKIVKDVVKSERSLTDYLPYLLSLLNLCLVGYLLYKSSKRQSRNAGGLERDLHKRINTAEEDINSISLKAQSLMDRVYKSESNIENLRRQVYNRNNDGDKLREERELTTPVQSGGGFYVHPDPNPAPGVREPEKCKYALYADTGDGFSVSSLSNQMSSDSLFEIRITSPTSAKLSVTQNESAQKMAFSDPYQYLRTTCTYSGDPGGRIRTNTPGELELVGNKWRILTKAEISFYR
ncbi:hypothetical protein [Runella sp.]|uniref:hypothetical protein n=1 Tax=Runella sp. TaxID=1960881 RepID=UPI003D0A3AE1